MVKKGHLTSILRYAKPFVWLFLLFFIIVIITAIKFYPQLIRGGNSLENTGKQLENDEKKFRAINKRNKWQIPYEQVMTFYDKIGPQKMLKIIEEDTYCHDKGHNVGRAIYEKTRDLNEAINSCSLSCTIGCFHGVLMGFFGDDIQKGSQVDDHVQIEKVKNQIKTICDKKEINPNIPKAACVHGVGHALLFLMDYDLNKALNLCELYENPGLVYYCAMGVHMERATVKGDEDAKISQIFPCNQTKFPAACFRYQMGHNFSVNQVDEARSFCLNMTNTDMQNACFHGLGHTFYNTIYKDASTLEKLCSGANETAEQMCFEGSVGTIAVFDIFRAQQICEILPGDLKKSCQKAVQYENYSMERKFSDYIIK